MLKKLEILLQHDAVVDVHFMNMALDEAHKAFAAQEVPVGAVLIKEGEVIARAHNRVEQLQDATAHAEILCIRLAGEQGENWRLLETTLYVTLEPCSMCLGALFLARVKRVVWGAKDLRHGACGSWVNLMTAKHPTHQLEVLGGVLEHEASDLMKQFFKLRRVEKSEQVSSR